jgi:hypothetical protein
MKSRPADNHMSADEVDLLVQSLLVRSGGQCEGRTPRCGAPGGSVLGMPREQVSVQHRKAQGSGGTSRTDVHGLHNVLLLCGTGVTFCHGWVECEERGLAWQRGLWIHQADDGATVPLVLHSGRRVLLHPTEPRYVEHPDPYGLRDGTVLRRST